MRHLLAIIASAKALSIGIDLGTSTSCCAVYRNGAPELVNAETFEGRKPAVATYTGSGSSTDIVVASAQVPPP